MRQPRGIFFLELLVYGTAIMVMLGSAIATVGLLLRGLGENKRQEQLAEERIEVTELLRTDLRAAHAAELLTVKTPHPGTKLRLTEAGDTVVEYFFTREIHVISTQGQVPAPPPNPRKSRSVSGSGPRTPPPPQPVIPPGSVGLSIDQEVEGPAELVRTVLVHNAPQSLRHWGFYAFKQLERSTSGTAPWELQTVKPGEKVDALTEHVFLLTSLEFISPQKAPRAVSIGATTRIEPVPAATEKP